MRRGRTSTLIVAAFIGGIVGAVLSHFLRGLFAPVAIRDFFFNTLNIGFSPFRLQLGFLDFTLGFFLHLSVFTCIFIVLAVWLAYKFS